VKTTAIVRLKWVRIFFAGHVLAAVGTSLARVMAQNAGSARPPYVQPGHPGENGAAAALLVGEAPEAGPGEKNVFLVSVRFSFCTFRACCNGSAKSTGMNRRC